MCAVWARGGQTNFINRKSSRERYAAVASTVVVMLLLLAGSFTVASPAFAQISHLLPPGAACSVLARQDPTATNGAGWGRTILSGHGARNGWFGVDVCGNGNNGVAPNSANVSCDRVPSNWPATGCAPGNATSDGYGLTFQCVELVIRFSAWAFGDAPNQWGRSGWGNAPDLWLPVNHPTDFVMYPNGSSHAPVPGDILVWGSVNSKGAPWPTGPDGTHGGHVAVVAAVRGGDIITAEENVKWGSDDHPSDRLALTDVHSHWIVSGSTHHDTSLPTYRWNGTMGTSRATYGWLHNVHNDGTFPAKHRATSTGGASSSSSATTTTPKQSPGGLPSLAGATVVTSGGTLADLVWFSSDFLPDANTTVATHATARSLGAPPGVHLIINQQPATVLLPDGTRFSYVVGMDGRLYAARTSPRTLGVFWLDYDMPTNVTLQPGVSATAFAGGIAVTARGADGNLWWRAGPVGQFGGWMSLGHPGTNGLTTSFAIAGSPGSGTPLVVALGLDGAVYERVWLAALLNSDGSVQAPAGWSDWMAIHGQPANTHFVGRLLVVAENVSPQYWIGGWPDTPLDVLALDTSGQIWWFRTNAIQKGWQISALTSSMRFTTLIAGTDVSPAPSMSGTSKNPTTTSSLIHIYALGTRGTYQGVLTLPGTAQGSTPMWTTLPEIPSSVSRSAGALAVAVGPGNSVLAAVAGNRVLAVGTRASVATLAPTMGGQSSASGWVSLGEVANGGTFDDPLTSGTVDARWYLVGSGAKAISSHSGVRLMSAQDEAALLQSAPVGDATVSTTITMTPDAATSTQAGLVLYLDDGDWMTLLTNRKGTVSFCAELAYQTSPCFTQTASKGTSPHLITVRISRTSANFTGSFSVDGAAWQTVGTWAPIAPSNPAGAGATAGVPSLTPTATATSGSSATSQTLLIAPIAFSSCGVLSVGSSSSSEALLLSDFQVAGDPSS